MISVPGRISCCLVWVQYTLPHSPWRLHCSISWGDIRCRWDSEGGGGAHPARQCTRGCGALHSHPLSSAWSCWCPNWRAERGHSIYNWHQVLMIWHCSVRPLWNFYHAHIYLNHCDAWAMSACIQKDWLLVQCILHVATKWLNTVLFPTAIISTTKLEIQLPGQCYSCSNAHKFISQQYSFDICCTKSNLLYLTM